MIRSPFLSGERDKLTCYSHVSVPNLDHGGSRRFSGLRCTRSVSHFVLPVKSQSQPGSRRARIGLLSLRHRDGGLLDEPSRKRALTVACRLSCCCLPFPTPRTLRTLERGKKHGEDTGKSRADNASTTSYLHELLDCEKDGPERPSPYLWQPSLESLQVSSIQNSPHTRHQMPLKMFLIMRISPPRTWPRSSPMRACRQWWAGGRS